MLRVDLRVHIVIELMSFLVKKKKIINFEESLDGGEGSFSSQGSFQHQNQENASDILKKELKISWIILYQKYRIIWILFNLHFT